MKILQTSLFNNFLLNTNVIAQRQMGRNETLRCRCYHRIKYQMITASQNKMKTLCTHSPEMFTKKQFHTQTILSKQTYIEGIKDKYNGITIDLHEISSKLNPAEFFEMLNESFSFWKKSKFTAVWLMVPITHSHFIPEAAKLGFEFHHAEGNQSVLCQWMDKSRPSKLPVFASHQVGCGGVVVKEDTREVLVVQDKARKWTLWKFPGGLSDLGEDIGETAEREVWEETGVKSKFQGILTFRQQHNQPGAFGRSDFYFLCHMKPLTFDLYPCEEEIKACEWMKIEDLAKNSATSAITIQTIKLLNKGLENGFDTVHLEPLQFKSIHKGLMFQLYHTKI